ncbi:MAG TPA: VOC family protein [Acidimicrobiia bacterium]|nr:VOC family protein [Acidimicrobiia bacterium]
MPDVAHVHHSAVVAHDVDASLRFYRDGLGLAVLMDHQFHGDWRTLFDAPRTASARCSSAIPSPRTPGSSSW